MPHWIKKVLVSFIAIATFGVYTPATLLEIEAEENDRNLAGEADISHDETVQEEKQYDEQVAEGYLHTLQGQVKEQSMVKFGPRISERVADEFTYIILPKIENVVEMILHEKDARYVSITENPTGGYGERIFNIVDVQSDETIAKFHVHRVHRPLEGYYFNFHYHLQSDDFETHHQLGEIFWDKNMPPKWMT